MKGKSLSEFFKIKPGVFTKFLKEEDKAIRKANKKLARRIARKTQ